MDEEQSEPQPSEKPTKKHKQDPHAAVLATATIADCVLAKQKKDWINVGSKSKQADPNFRSRLLTIKGVDVTKIQAITLRDYAKARFDESTASTAASFHGVTALQYCLAHASAPPPMRLASFALLSATLIFVWSTPTFFHHHLNLF